MTLDVLLPVLVFAAIAVWAAGAVRRVMLWRRGRPARVDWIGGLLAAPRRYLVDLHDVVARDRQAARFHVPAAGGFVAAMILVVLVHGFGIAAPVLVWMLLAALAAMFLGAFLVAMRRYGGTVPPRLSRGGFQRLPASLIVFAGAFALVTLPAAGLLPAEAWRGGLALLLALLVVWGLAEMLVGMTWGGPMKHVFAGILHLAYHPRPLRFSGPKRSTDLAPVDLQSPKLGAERPSDLPWNRLLGFDACVQCGRCEEMCPAYAAGQPLSPKKFIQDMVIGMAGGTDGGYRGKPYPGRALGEARGAPEEPVVPGLVRPETLWSCTTCRACVYECPMMIEHVDTIVDLRRFLTMEKGATPGKGGEVLEDIRATDSPSGQAAADRVNWCTDLAIPRMAEVGATDVLLWVGDAAFDLRNQRTLRAVAQLLRRAGVDFAILGEEERDCGDLARRLGDEVTFRDLAQRNITTLRRYEFTRIVTADPHAFHVLANEYPAFGGHYRVVHHTQLLDELVAAGRLPAVRPLVGTVTYHDPCYLGRYNGEVTAPRALLRHLGADLREMERSGFRSRCCGGGGGAPVTDIPGERRIPDMRMADVRETGAGVVAVACPQCCTMLEGVVQPRAEVRDVAELLLEAVEP